MAAPDAVLELVERFERNRAQYHNPAYNETQVRREFLDPLFTALGWDVDNTAGHAQQYKDVVHEDAIKVGLDSRAPDYSFRIGGQRKFFVEAKKPAVNLKDDPAPAYQLRRYAWSAKLPLSILTDFQELAVYDGRVKPAASDKPSTARTLYVPFEHYDERWDEIAGVFSKEAILQGSFDRYAESTKAKKGTAEVDKAFLGEIEGWRDALARTIALRNPSLSQRELNYAVQATIDRLIFLRICEDRGIEPYGRLQGLCNGGGTYGRMRQLFYEADQRYNSGLFHFEDEKGRAGYADRLTLGLAIDDKPLKDILKRLYYPDSPYEFSVLPADILGQVYEQFLGKVIRLTAGHRAVVEDKPEVKKAGGVYYTPTYIVDYIVKHTVGRLLEGKTPKQAASLRILDPACGSGSFLIGAYQYLLDWHRDWYAADAQGSAKKHAKALYQGRGGEWRLTTAEKKRILLNNIYGVDIDAQAVETTKLSLLLKVLEGETAESIDAQLSFLRERALPDLSANIKCGNSLIGPDFYDDQQLGLAGLGEEERYRINVFDWEAEFPEILGKAVPEEKRGFDAVIGNPPYVRQEALSEFKQYFAAAYSSYQGTADLYVYFIERGIRVLRPSGLFSFIVSSSFLRANFGRGLRTYLASAASVDSFVDFGGSAVFANAKDTYVTIPVIQREPQAATYRVFTVGSAGSAALDSAVDGGGFECSAARLTSESWSLDIETKLQLMTRLVEKGVTLGEYMTGRVCYGIKTGLNEAFVIDGARRDELLAQDPRSSEIIKPFVQGRDIKRWTIDRKDAWIIFTRRGIDISNYPAIRRHLEEYRRVLEPRPADWPQKKPWPGRKPGAYQWYEIQDDVAYYRVFDEPKIVYPDIAKGTRFCLDRDGAYIGNTAYCIGSSDPYLLALLNSRLMWFCISSLSIPFGTRAGKFRYRLIYQYMKNLPVIPTTEDRGQLASVQAQIAAVGEQLSRVVPTLGEGRAPQDHAAKVREVAALEGRLNRLVYDLYGLTDDEIALVESSFE